MSLETRLRRGLMSGAAAMVFAFAPAMLAPAPAMALAAQEVAQTENEDTEDARLAAFFEEIFQRNLSESPPFQAQLGIITEDYGEWGDGSDAEARRVNLRTADDLDRLHDEFDYEALSDRMKISYRIFEFQQERSLRNFRWRHHGYPFSTMNNPATGLATFMQNIHRVSEVSHAEAYISRLNGVPEVMDDIIEGIDMSAEIGVVPTSFSFDPIIADTRAVITGAPFDDSPQDSALLADFRRKVNALDIPDTEKQRLLTEGVMAMAGAVKPAFERFIARVEALRPLSHGPNGVWAQPDGAAYYETQVRFWTTVPGLGADEIHNIGLAEVARLRGEMEAIREAVGFDGSLEDFFTFLRTDPSNFYPDTDEGRDAYLAESKRYIDEMYETVDQYFNILPKAPLEVRRVEEWREATAPIAFYNQPSQDGSRPGIYYTNLANMTSKQKHEIESIAYHEGAPGHHFQIALAQELEGVPTFQKFAFFGAYVEGWGLYAERLGKEMGKFEDPYQDFGRLQNEMLRAIRLVVDTGAHSKGWTREQMIDYMLANSAMSEHEATKETERYIDLPGQALSYKIGMLKILELRKKARDALGSRFDIGDFHDVVLTSGPVPLSILEDLVDAYIAETGAN